MRILAAFLSVIFMFLNPAMLLNVVKEMDKFFKIKQPDHLQMDIFEAMSNFLLTYNLVSKLKILAYCTVITVSIVHMILTVILLYGLYACRPAFVRPMLIDVTVSLVTLLLFTVFSLLMCWRLNAYGTFSDEEQTSTHLRNVYVGAAFLLVYFVWMAISLVAYWDVKRLHADFMYWIVEERETSRRPHCVSENRSDRSSKTSKTSKTSTRSTRIEQPLSRPSSAAGSLNGSKKTSLANNRRKEGRPKEAPSRCIEESSVYNQ